ncbi:hypothetical protein EYF80_057048 [Liparis tanakae]|uniref:Uncharacterized protein n=1 Tax=Liparis tanakae TaxID=230148 RepID=A0A4Z2EVF4_9TELE|nr:hypothetical protein EYF80_057048 [Liparis tanakae]
MHLLLFSLFVVLYYEPTAGILYAFHGRGDLPPQVEKSQRQVSKREERESSEKRGERAAQSCRSSTRVLLRGRRVGTWGGGTEGRGSQDRRTAESREEERERQQQGRLTGQSTSEDISVWLRKRFIWLKKRAR